MASFAIADGDIQAALLPEAIETVFAYPLSEEVGQTAAGSEILNALESHNGSSPTAIYVHVPFCLHLCEFCGFVKSQYEASSSLQDYVEEVVLELELIHRHLSSPPKIDAIYFGGGTPSLLAPKDVGRILECVSRLFDVAADAELSFEGEALTLLKTGYLDEIARLGFQRLSFGVQTLDPGYRELLNLKPTNSQLKTVLEKSHSRFSEITFDMIYGFPGTTKNFIDQDFSKAAKLASGIADAIEVFRFEIVDASPRFLLSSSSAGLPPRTPQELEEFDEVAFGSLENCGFRRAGFSMACGPEAHVTNKYGDLYYGYGNGQVLGVGRGAQSFFNGVMWGNNLSAAHHVTSISEERFPSTEASAFVENERELVMWPKRGWVPKSLIEGVSDQDTQEKIQNLLSHNIIFDADQTYRVSESNQKLVPRIINFLLPKKQAGLAFSTTKQRMRGIRTNAERTYMRRGK